MPFLWIAECRLYPSTSGNTTLHRLQSIMMWLSDNQSMQSITSRPSNGKQMRFTLNLCPATSIGHSVQTKLVMTSPEAGVKTASSYPKSWTTRPSLLTHSCEMNEWVAAESNSTKTLLSNNKHRSSMRLPDLVASVLVNANTLPATRGRSAITLCCFYDDGFSPVAFLSGHWLA